MFTQLGLANQLLRSVKDKDVKESEFLCVFVFCLVLKKKLPEQYAPHVPLSLDLFNYVRRNPELRCLLLVCAACAQMVPLLLGAVLRNRNWMQTLGKP